MSTPERSFGTKFVDNLFSGAPFNVFTSDRGVELSQLQGIHEALDQHRDLIERSLSQGTSLIPVHDPSPQYLPSPEIIIDTRELADAQWETARQMEGVFETTRELVQATQAHTPLFRRMISNQGITHAHLEEGNVLSQLTNRHLQQGNTIAYQAMIAAFHQRGEMIDAQHGTNSLLEEGNTLLVEGNELQEEANQIALQTAAQAFDQRNAMIRQLSQSLVNQGEMIEQIRGVGGTIQYQAEATRRHLHTLLTDIGGQILNMTNDQLITRMSVLQSLYELHQTFLQTHEQVMLSHQQQRGDFQRVIEAAEMTEQEKQAKKIWKRAERLRRAGDLNGALAELKGAYALDPESPLINLSLGTIHTTFGNAERATFAFANADNVIEHNPQMSVYALLNLSINLHDLGRHEHAERAMRKATKLDPGNPEVWYHYAKSAWKMGRRDVALSTLRALLQTHPQLYRARMAVDPNLEELRSELFS